jgi:putative nucleotidyltransferase with HDIG domain
VAVKKNNFRRLLLTFEALADLGPQMTAERSFPETAQVLLRSLMDAVGAQEGALFTFSDRPAALSCAVQRGFLKFPQAAVIPLLPRHIHALVTARVPQALTQDNRHSFLSSNGNVAPEMFKCVAPLRAGQRLVGVVALGRREGDAPYESDELEALDLLSHYVALAVHNYNLTQSLEQRITENLRLLASLHTFYDNALETIATAIDVKHINVQGHSLRVGRYAASIGDAMGLEPSEISGLRAAGYLHDIGKVAVDKHIFYKPAALDEQEFREMAEHTVVGHKIVTGVEFPWPRIPEVVRSHHERGDGSGYPDSLHMDDISQPVRIVAIADTFDAMLCERPYRQPLTVGEALSEIVRLTPQKLDPLAVQALLIQIRRDAVGSNKTRFLDERFFCNIGVSDIDQLAALLQHKLSANRKWLN